MNMHPDIAFATAERRDSHSHPLRTLLSRLVLFRKA
jgi:hypothetical protein